MLATDQLATAQEKAEEQVPDGASWFLSGTVECQSADAILNLGRPSHDGFRISIDYFAYSDRTKLDGSGSMDTLEREHGEMRSAFRDAVYNGCLTAFQSMSLITHRSLFVVERQVRKKPRERAVRMKLLRSHERSIFSLVTVGRIQRDLGLGHSSRSEDSPARTVASHPRAGHWRYYTDARFSDAVRARPQWIKTTWIGPESTVVKGQRYIVRTEL